MAGFSALRGIEYKRMALLVLKFGGTSVGTVERIEAVADKVARFKAAGDNVVVVSDPPRPSVVILPCSSTP